MKWRRGGTGSVRRDGGNILPGLKTRRAVLENGERQRDRVWKVKEGFCDGRCEIVMCREGAGI